MLRSRRLSLLLACPTDKKILFLATLPVVTHDFGRCAERNDADLQSTTNQKRNVLHHFTTSRQPTPTHYPIGAPRPCLPPGPDQVPGRHLLVTERHLMALRFSSPARASPADQLSSLGALFHEHGAAETVLGDLLVTVASIKSAGLLSPVDAGKLKEALFAAAESGAADLGTIPLVSAMSGIKEGGHSQAETARLLIDLIPLLATVRSRLAKPRWRQRRRVVGPCPFDRR